MAGRVFFAIRLNGGFLEQTLTLAQTEVYRLMPLYMLLQQLPGPALGLVTEARGRLADLFVKIRKLVLFQSLRPAAGHHIPYPLQAFLVIAQDKPADAAFTKSAPGCDLRRRIADFHQVDAPEALQRERVR